MDELRQRLAEIEDELGTLGALDEPTEEDEARYAELDDEADVVMADIEKQETRAAKLAEIRNRIETGELKAEAGTTIPIVDPGTAKGPYSADDVRASTSMPNAEVRRLAVESIGKDDTFNDVDADHVRAIVEKDASGRVARHVVAAASDAYRTGWAKAITGHEYLLESDEREALSAVRAASLTDGEGGYAVPVHLDPTLVLTAQTGYDPMRQIARLETTVTDTWSGLTSAGVSASFDAEAAEVSDDAATLVNPSITPAKAQVFVPFSIEIGQDWANMAGDVATLFAEAKEALEATAFITGSGSDAPVGLITALLAASTTSGVDATTASTFGVEDVYLVHEALPRVSRMKASWMAHILIQNNIRQFGTTSLSEQTVDLMAGGIPQLLGKPLYESTAMDSVVTTDAEILVFGDFKKYVIVDRVGFNVEFIPHLFATANNLPSGQRGWYGYWRVGGDSIDDDAFRYLQP